MKPKMDRRGRIKKAMGGDMSLEFSREAYSPNPRENINGYMLDKGLSNRRTLTYHNPETKQTYIAHKGTDPSSRRDLKNDFLIATGMLNKYTSKRVRNASNIAQGVQQKYGPNITNVGHSLGGTMAEKTAMGLNPESSRAISYNPGMSPLIDFGKGLYNKAQSFFNPKSAQTQKLQNVTRHTTGVDPISMGGLLHAGQTVLHKPKSFEPHGLANFKKGGSVHHKQPTRRHEMKDFDLHHYQAGFPGHDPMRSNAERLFAENLNVKGHFPMKESVSAQEHEKRRPFKRGGHVTHHEHGHKMHHHKKHHSHHGEHHEEHHHKKHHHHEAKHKHNPNDILKSMKHHHNESYEDFHHEHHMKRGGHHEMHHQKHHARHHEVHHEHPRHHEHKHHVSKARQKLHHEQERELSHVKHLIHKEGKLGEMKKGGRCAKGGRVHKNMGGPLGHAMGQMAQHAQQGAQNMAHHFGNMAGNAGRAAHHMAGALSSHHRNMMAIGGAGKIRHGQMTKSGKQISKRGRKLGQ